MKKVKVFLTVFAVVATVGSALAVKANFFNQGTVYCTSTCSVASRVDFRLNPNGASTNPCGTTGGVENASYMYGPSCTCVKNNLGCHYDVVNLGK